MHVLYSRYAAQGSHTLVLSLSLHSGHIDYCYPLECPAAEREKAYSKRWTDILKKNLNPKCRQYRKHLASDEQHWTQDCHFHSMNIPRARLFARLREDVARAVRYARRGARRYERRCDNSVETLVDNTRTRRQGPFCRTGIGHVIDQYQRMVRICCARSFGLRPWYKDCNMAYTNESDL